jgi:hypothetical protein
MMFTTITAKFAELDAETTFRYYPDAYLKVLSSLLAQAPTTASALIELHGIGDGVEHGEHLEMARSWMAHAYLAAGLEGGDPR